MPCNPPCNDAWNTERDYRESVLRLLRCIYEGNIEGINYDYELLCDPSDGRTIVVRYCHEEDGTACPTVALELDGTAYAGDISLLVPCIDEGLLNTVLLCDLDEYGDVISPFLAHIRITAGAPASFTFTEVDSVTPYVITGTPGACDTAEDSADAVLFLCDNNGINAVTPFLRKIEGVTVTDTTLDGTTPYTPTGTVEKCHCYTINTANLCDDDDGTSFLRHYVADQYGLPLGTFDTDFDGASYTVVGNAVACNACCEAATANVTPVTAISTTSGSTTAGRARVSITNTGGANGTANGLKLVPGETVTYDAYYDWNTQSFQRLASIAWDATGTEFRIDETP